MRHQLSSSSTQAPKVIVQLKSKFGSKSAKSKGGQKNSGGSFIRSCIELLMFIVWLGVTGAIGYTIGHAPAIQKCPPPATPEIVEVKHDCIHNELGEGVSIGAVSTEDGLSIEELKRQWTCSHAVSNFSQATSKIYPKEKNLDKTKWKSILSVEPKAFFDKYLTQYPGDIRAVQPVVVFSHRPVSKFEEIPDVCKVIDVAVVPDTPGVCVAVTETFHDVASYHMLHADKQADGSYALTANSLEGRDLPDQAAYSAARALLLEYFQHVEYVNKLVKQCPSFKGNKVSVGVLVESAEEADLFKNSLESASAVGINKNKFCLFTTQLDVHAAFHKNGIKTIFLQELSDVGKSSDAAVGADMRRYFLQAWLAFAVSNALNKMMWQSPGTVWFARPDDIVSQFPSVEVLWSYKGRRDKRAAPFFGSFDFFVPTGHERPVHLLHEVLLHFDLVLAWKSLDAVAAYRLSENNARYGTTTFIMPPHKVLHTELMAHHPDKIMAAIQSADKPLVIVFPREGVAPGATTALLKQCNLWFL